MKRSGSLPEMVERQEANMAGVDAQDALDKRAAKAASGRSAEAVAVEQHEAAVGMMSKLSSLAADLDVDLERREASDSSSPIARLQKAAKRAKDEGDLSQAEKFAQAARDLGADQDEDAFKGMLRKLATKKT